MLSGPVAPFGRAGDSLFARPAGRTRPEGEENSAKARGTVGMILQVEGTRITSITNGRRPMKSEPKDHVRENIRRMRHIQKACREREAESKQPMKALWKTAKYGEVQSRVRDALERPAAPAASRPQSANSYLRAHSRTGWTPVARRPGSAGDGTGHGTEQNEVQSHRPSTSTSLGLKPSVPRAGSARELQLKRNEIDFIKANGRAARHASMRRSPSLSALDDIKKKTEDEAKNYQKGTTPKYLVNRQRQWQQDEEYRIANIPDPDMPPGHKVMATADRLSTLDKLKESQKQLLQQLSCMPIRTDTLRLRTRKNEIDAKLAEVEEAIKIFSRPKVFVALEA